VPLVSVDPWSQGVASRTVPLVSVDPVVVCCVVLTSSQLCVHCACHVVL